MGDNFAGHRVNRVRRPQSPFLAGRVDVVLNRRSRHFELCGDLADRFPGKMSLQYGSSALETFSVRQTIHYPLCWHCYR
jgi:hypothetical protein